MLKTNKNYIINENLYKIKINQVIKKKIKNYKKSNQKNHLH
jgi:hypothetical protein